jgi:hypothetical protein
MAKKPKERDKAVKTAAKAFEEGGFTERLYHVRQR